MEKRICILAAALCFGLCTTIPYPKLKLIVRAKESSAASVEEQMKMWELASRGNVVYREDGKEAGIYTSDFLLLYEKLSMVSGEAFDPACYTHTHQWEYRDVNEHSHTRHCAICGDAFDLAEAHKADSEDDCTISCGGKEFSGRCYKCVCGYQWKVEKAHTLTFDMVDETRHRSRCLLDGTEYCLGYEPVEEEHYAFHHTENQEGTHYIKTCIDCGYQTEEACEPEEITEESEEEPSALEQREPSEEMETTGQGEPSEEMETTGQGEPPEEPETPEQGEPSKESTVPEPGKQPEISVSGNDCTVNETRGKAAEETEKIVDERGGHL